MFLKDIKVLDLGSYVAGPAAATVMSDFGADVVKIEPLDGDPYRRLLGHAVEFYPNFFWRARSIIIVFVLLNCFRKMSAGYCVKLLAEYVSFQITSVFIKKRSQLNASYISLRKFLRKKTTPYDNPAMAALRKGR